MLRMFEHVTHTPALDELAVLHDRDLVRHLRHHAEVMRNEQNRASEFALQAFDQAKNLA
jgi:hypothetical protein